MSEAATREQRLVEEAVARLAQQLHYVASLEDVLLRDVPPVTWGLTTPHYQARLTLLARRAVAAVRREKTYGARTAEEERGT